MWTRNGVYNVLVDTKHSLLSPKVLQVLVGQSNFAIYFEALLFIISGNCVCVCVLSSPSQSTFTTRYQWYTGIVCSRLLHASHIISPVMNDCLTMFVLNALCLVCRMSCYYSTTNNDNCMSVVFTLNQSTLSQLDNSSIPV